MKSMSGLISASMVSGHNKETVRIYFIHFFTITPVKLFDFYALEKSSIFNRDAPGCFEELIEVFKSAWS